MTKAQEVGTRLKEARTQSKYTQKKVAEILNIHLSQWQKYEYGNLELDYNKMITVCKLFDISSDYLLGLKKNEYE